MGISFSILVLLLAVINPILRKWIVGTGGQYISETTGKHIDIWGRIVLTKSIYCITSSIANRSNILLYFYLLMILKKYN